MTTEAFGLSRVRGLRLAFQVPLLNLQLSNAGSLSLIMDLAQHITDGLLGINWARARPGGGTDDIIIRVEDFNDS